MEQEMRDFSCYLFDADGTLFDTTELIYACFTHTALSFGHAPIERPRVLQNIGLTLRDQMNMYFGPFDDLMFQKYRAVHMDFQMSIYKKHLALFDGVEETVKKLKDLGKRCAVVTSRFHQTLDLFLKETGIFRYFDVLVTPEDTVKHKPEPEPALRALQLLECKPADGLFIGDATFDIECGNSAGMATAFVGWSNTPVSLLTVQPTYIITTMSELCIHC
jgi:pyrophosphatase PpaX